MIRISPIPGYGDKYRVRSDGVVLRWSTVEKEYLPIATSGDPPRVRLYTRGKQWRPYVHTLVERLFGDTEDM